MLRKADKLIFMAMVVAVLAASIAVYLVAETGVAGVNNLRPPFSGVSSAEAASVAEPVLLRIPRLNVEADVKRVGVNSEGNMGVLASFSDVAWYKHGVMPGEKGSAVMAGHLDNALALPGVFHNLHKLEPGDVVEVETAGGATLKFKVEEVRVYKNADLPAERVFNRDDKPRLNLVTCAGAWDQAHKTYEERLIVYTTMVQ